MCNNGQIRLLLLIDQDIHERYDTEMNEILVGGHSVNLNLGIPLSLSNYGELINLMQDCVSSYKACVVVVVLHLGKNPLRIGMKKIYQIFPFFLFPWIAVRFPLTFPTFNPMCCCWKCVNCSCCLSKFRSFYQLLANISRR